MKKRLLVFSDGTWNTWNKGKDTNVARLYRLLREIPGEQMRQYDPGGGSRFFRLTGGVFGVGITETIKRLYRFLVLNYAPGDKLYLFGFSRGAFTVRSLAGLLETCGVLTEDRAALIDQAFAFYKEGRSRESEHFRQAYSHKDLEIRVIGVWETVGALGVPFDKLNRLNPFSHRFHDTRLGRHVRYGLHAVAVDENRYPFKPALWTESYVPSPEEAPVHGQEIEQVWFPGVHADVGGGYPETGLSDVSLSWMIGKLRKNLPELSFRPVEESPFRLEADPAVRMHDERKHVYGLWRPHYRTIKPKALVHEAVLQRRERKASYRPPNLPESLTLVETEPQAASAPAEPDHP